MKLRPGILVSSGAHAVLLAYAIVGLSSAKPFETAPIDALPVEILSPEQFDAMTKGSKASKKVEAPKQKVDKVAAADPKPVDDDLKVAKEEVKAPPPAPSAKDDSPPVPDPAIAKAKAEAEKAEAAKAESAKAEAAKAEAAKAEAAKAEKVAQETAAEAKAEKAAQAKAAEAKANAEKAEKLAQAAEAEKVAKAEAQKAAQEKAAAEKAAAEKAEAEKAAKLAAEKAAKEKAEKLAKAEAEKVAKAEKAAKEKAEAEKAKAAQRKFDLASIEKMLDSKTSSRSDSALHDVREPSRKASEGQETAPETTAGTDRGTSPKLSASERSAIGNAIISQVSPCWSPPVGAAADSNLVVTVKFQLNSDGTLVGSPTVVNSSSNPAFRAAAGAAMRAIQRCAPIKLPAESYDYWRQVNVNFDPKDLMGG